MTLTEVKRRLKSLILSSKHVRSKKQRFLEKRKSEYDYSKKTPTILCSNCIGGMIYSNLGLRFMSPTINLWCDAEDLAKVAQRPEHYLSQQIEFVRDDPEYRYDYPVGKIDDVYLYFTHYKTEEEAARKWYERRGRFDSDNVYIITDNNGLSETGREKLINSRHRRLVIFTGEAERDEYDFQLHHDMRKSYSIRNYFGFAPFEEEFNYAAWLSDKENYRAER